MSKIQFNELNASEFNALNQEETTAVVGGYGYGYWGDYIAISVASDNDVVKLAQGNSNFTQQTGLGGFFGNVVNNNGTGQNNSANIGQ